MIENIQLIFIIARLCAMCRVTNTSVLRENKKVVKYVNFAG